MSHALRSRRLLTVAAAGAIAALVLAVLGMGGSASARSSHRGHHKGKSHQHSGRHHSPGDGSLSITHQSWGTADGKPVNLYTLSDGHKMIVNITNYGGVVQSIQ